MPRIWRRSLGVGAARGLVARETHAPWEFGDVLEPGESKLTAFTAMLAEVQTQRPEDLDNSLQFGGADLQAG